MKILQVSGVFCDNAGGGVGDYICSLGSRLVKLGHEVEVIAYSHGPPKREHHGLVVHHVPLSSVLGFRYFQWGRDANRLVKNLQKSARFDIVHAHTTSMAFPLFYDSSEPLVITSHGTSIDPIHGIPRRLVLAQVERKYYRKAARVVAVGSSVKRELLKTGVPESIVEVIPNGTDSSRFDHATNKKTARAMLGIHPEEIVVLFVGAHTERKGFRILLEVMKRTLSGEIGPFRFLIPGTGPLTSSLQRLAARWPQISALGFVSEPFLATLYAAADLFIFPSLYEGLPTAVLDALGFGIPILAADIPALRESLAPGSAMFVKPNDVDSLLQALARIASNPGMLVQMGNVATVLSTQFQWDPIVHRIVQLYLEVRSASTP